MNPDEAFLAVIRAAPDDDLPRLVYADWLDEHGDPGDVPKRHMGALYPLTDADYV